MFTGSIKISELDQLGIVVSNDFFPLVQSGSLTTFRVSIATLGQWFAASGSCLSASWASSSISSSYALSASAALKSISASYSLSASAALLAISASYAKSASAAINTISSSFASNATSASYAPFNQAVQASSSWASQSLSSSFAVSASWAPALADTVPIGTIMAFASSSAPNNWLECNGAALSTASFSQLYAAIQTSDSSASFGFLCDSFGNRNSGGAFFKLPDLRGEFLRGWDHNRGVDLGRGNTSFQVGSIQAHKHIAPLGEEVIGGNAPPFGFGGANNNYGSNGGIDFNNPWSFTNDGTAVGSANPNSVGVIGTETRPRNVAIMYCIKYSNVTNFATTGITLAGDVVGTSSATLVTAIQGVQVTSSAPSDGQVLQYSAAAGKWTPTTPGSSGLVAWATILVPTASNYSSDNPTTVATGNSTNKPIIVNGFNVSDVSWTARTVNPSAAFMGSRPASRTNPSAGPVNFLVTLINSASNANFGVMGSGHEPDSYGEDMLVCFYPFQQRTTSQFTMSLVGGNDSSGGSEWYQFTFTVYA